MEIARRLRAAAVVSALLAAGCGYSTRSLLPAHLKTIYVPIFKENFEFPHQAGGTQRFDPILPGVGADVTKEVIHRFFIDGRLRVANDENGDAVLFGEVVGFRRTPLSYTDADEVKEYRVTILVNAIFRDRRENRVLWEVKNFAGEATYLTQSGNEDDAVKTAVTDLARRLVNQAIEQW